MTAPTLERLARWREAGWLRRLDVALAAFVAEAAPATPPALLLLAAWASHADGRGHSALPLAALQADPGAALAWPPEAAAEARAALAALSLDPAAWQGQPAIEIDPGDERGASPLVLAGGLLHLRRHWRCERRVAAQVCRLVAQPVQDDVLAAAAWPLLDRLFDARPAGAAPDWQRVACAIALRGRLTLVTGGPGTGKTFTAARLLVLLNALHAGPQPLRVALAAPTGKAAARLRQAIGQALQQLPADVAVPEVGAARTLHALLGAQPGTRRFRHDAANPLALDLLLVDEASMVHLELMAQLLEALPAHARVVLLGDPDQLASVEAGAVLAELCQGAGAGWPADTAAWLARASGQAVPVAAGAVPALAAQTVVLRESRRFGGPIGQLAQAVNAGDAAGALALLRAVEGPVALRPARDPAALLPLALAGYRGYLEHLAARPADAAAFDGWAREVLRRFDAFRVLCALRDGPWGVAGLNAAIAQVLADAGLLARRGEWFEGRPVMVTRNDPAAGVFNGDIGIVLRAPGGTLRCAFLDGEALRTVAVTRLAEVETAFAMTVHKSQGSEFAHVALVLPEADTPLLTRELLYTGITRASRAFTLVAADAGVLAAAAGRLTQRASGLRTQLAGSGDAR